MWQISARGSYLYTDESSLQEKENALLAAKNLLKWAFLFLAQMIDISNSTKPLCGRYIFYEKQLDGITFLSKITWMLALTSWIDKLDLY